MPITTSKLPNETTSLTSGVTGVLPIANGGTNSSTALNNNRIIQSSAGAIIEAAAITASRALKSDANGIPVASTATSTSLDALSGTNTGDASFTTFGSTPNANGGSISAQIITLQPADATNPGGISTGSQTIAGAKNFKASTQIASDAASAATIGNASSTATHALNGGLTMTTRSTSSNLTVDTTTKDHLIFVDTSGGAVSITLPTPTNGRRVILKDSTGNFATNNCTVVRNASEKIEGLAASKILQSNWQSIMFVSNGTDWFMF